VLRENGVDPNQPGAAALEPVLRKAAGEFPAVILTGARQSGKTTLLKHVFGETSGYVSLEPPDVRAAAAADPRGFLEMHPAPVIFDEVQYAPDLLPYVKERIDERRDAHGQYVLTGSQNLLLTEQVTESLAGRAAMLRLWPVSQREQYGRSLDPWPWEPPKKHPAANRIDPSDLWTSFLGGGYPELVADPDSRHRAVAFQLRSDLPGTRRPLAPPNRGSHLVPEFPARTRSPDRPTAQS